MPSVTNGGGLVSLSRAARGRQKLGEALGHVAAGPQSPPRCGQPRLLGQVGTAGTRLRRQGLNCSPRRLFVGTLESGRFAEGVAGATARGACFAAGRLGGTA